MDSQGGLNPCISVQETLQDADGSRREPAALGKHAAAYESWFDRTRNSFLMDERLARPLDKTEAEE